MEEEEGPKPVNQLAYIDYLEEYIMSRCKIRAKKGADHCEHCGECPITYRIRELKALGEELSKNWIHY